MERERPDEARVPGFLRLVEECQRVGGALQDLDLEDPVPEVDDPGACEAGDSPCWPMIPERVGRRGCSPPRKEGPYASTTEIARLGHVQRRSSGYNQSAESGMFGMAGL